jgi:hypothetical protein
MKATTKLQVPSTMVLRIDLELTVEEADSLLEQLKGLPYFNGGRLQAVLAKSLNAARASHAAEHDTSPT